MNIAVNTRLLINDIHGGIEWFTYESLKRITRAHSEHTFYFLFDRPYSDKYIFSENVKPIQINPPAVHPILWYLWFECFIPPVLKKLKAELFISTEGMMPLRVDIPCITVIHDINFFHRKRGLPPLKSLYYRKYFRKFAFKANRIITVSEYSKQDMVNAWNIDPNKIDLAFNAAGDEFYPGNPTLHPGIREKFSKGRPYFLFVGNISPRKNIPNLIRAYNNYRSKSQVNACLLIAGERFFRNSELDRVCRQSPFRDDIIFLGKKSRDELRSLYSAARALVFVPWFEGFGIPVLEAMKCGTPVIISSTTSLPEVAGDAALITDPDNPGQIADGMLRLELEETLRNDLIKKGFVRAQRFSWDSTAASIWDSVEKTIKNI